jgi:uncharacterized membrane protein YfcA
MTLTLVLIAGSLALAGAIKGLFGMGLPTVSMALLGLVMSPVQAATLLVIPTLLTNIWQLATGPDVRGLLKRFVTLGMTLCVGTAIGIGFLTSDSVLVSLALGGVLVVYGCVGLLSAQFVIPIQHERWLSPTVGLLTGIVNGATGLSTIPLVPYLNSLGLQRDELIQSMGLIFTVSIIALSACLAFTGHLQLHSMGASALSLIPVFAGMFVGTLVRKKLHADAFRKWFFIGLIALGGYLAIRAAARFF